MCICESVYFLFKVFGALNFINRSNTQRSYCQQN